MTRICDELYAEELGIRTSRTEYQIHSLSLVEKYLAGEHSVHADAGELQHDHLEFDKMLDIGDHGDLQFAFDFDAASKGVGVDTNDHFMSNPDVEMGLRLGVDL